VSQKQTHGPWALADLQEFANSRGGECLSLEMGEKNAPHRFRCARDHEFEASPFTVIRGGFWCDRCQPPLDGPGPWDWDAVAQADPTLARFQPQAATKSKR
jgi:hypothetical protein